MTNKFVATWSSAFGRFSNLFVLSAVTLALWSSFVVRAQQTESKSEMAAAKFPRLVEEYLQDLHARHPALAAASGIHAWDGQLEDYSAQAIAAEIAAIKAFQSRLEKIPPLELALSDTFDYQILLSNMNARLLELEQIKSYERNPQVYNEPISTGLLQIAMFEYAPPDSRLRHVIAKEKLVPRLLDSARANIHKPPAVFLKIAIESLKGTLSFVQTDLPKAFASVKDTVLEAKTTGAVKAALELNRTLEPYPINVDTEEDGVVVLRGEVPQAEIRAAAERVAAAVPSVRRVKNELRINPNLPVQTDAGRTLGENLDDKALEAKVHLAFSLTRQLKGTDLSVSAYRKGVTLRGEVDDEAQRRLAVEVARQTKDVQDVVDEIRIKGKAGVSSSVAANVERALKANPHLAPYEIKVLQEGGKVVLTGRVKTGAEKDLAGLVAKDAGGGQVTNSLEVQR